MATKEELKVLAVANFVKTKFKANLIRKEDVVQLLLMAARSIRDDENHEVPESWIKEDLVSLYDHSQTKGIGNVDVKSTIRVIK